MMFVPGPFEILLLLFAIGLPLLVILMIVRFVMRAVGGGGAALRDTAGAGISLGHATLTCPHCQTETNAGRPQCEHCGADLSM